MRLAASLRRLPWERLSTAFAAVTLGASQIVFTLIAENRDHFPAHAAFHLWILAWFLLLPVLFVFGCDLALSRPPEERTARIWRTVLYATVLVSLVHQARVYYPSAFGFAGSLAAAGLLYLVVAGGAVFLAARYPAGFRKYFAYLGVLGLVLVANYLRVTVFSGTPGEEAPRPAPAASTAPPAYVLLFDEMSYDVLLKGGRIDAEAFPNLAALAERSAWFTNATTNYRGTREAVPAMLSGRLEERDRNVLLFGRLPEDREVFLVDPFMITENWVRSDARLRGRVYFRGRARLLTFAPLEIPKYVLAAFVESPMFLGPVDDGARGGTPDPLRWDNLDRHDWVPKEFRLLLDLVRAPETSGRLTYWHCVLPHAPFALLPDGSRHGRRGLGFSGPMRRGDGAPVEEIWRNYRDQVRYVDRLLGEFLAALKAAGLEDSSVVIVTSDHGVRTGGAFHPEGYPKVRGGVTARVPLLIRAPGVEPGRYDADVQSVDFAPTLLDVLDIPYEASDFDGVSAFAQDRPVRPKIFRNDFEEYRLDPESGLWKFAGKREP